MTVAELIKELVDTGHLDYTVDVQVGEQDEARVTGIADVAANVSGGTAPLPRSSVAGWVTLELAEPTP